jgi:hypothetical protein
MAAHEMAFDPLGISHSRHGSGTSWLPTRRRSIT